MAGTYEISDTLLHCACCAQSKAHLLNTQLVEHVLQDLVVVDHVIVVLGIEVNLQLQAMSVLEQAACA
jgi:hypothetical protein